MTAVYSVLPNCTICNGNIPGTTYVSLLDYTPAVDNLYIENKLKNIYTLVYSLNDPFFEGTGIWSPVFFVSASVRDSRNWNFSVKPLRSSAVFGGRLKRPSPSALSVPQLDVNADGG